MENLTSIKHTIHASRENFDQLISEGWKLLHVCSQTVDGRVDITYVMGHEGPLPKKPNNSFTHINITLPDNKNDIPCN